MAMSLDHNRVLENAMRYVRQMRPDASSAKHAAFANSVATLVTGFSGGYGGPSVREHAVGRLYVGEQVTVKTAYRRLLDGDGPIFGPLTDLHRFCWENEHCFDDDPEDVAELQGSH